MAIGEIDLTLPARNLELFLTKPNREVVAKLSEAYNKKMVLKLGNINEITFTIPYDIDKNRKIIVNPHIDLLRERYLIKAVFAGKTEWYKIINIIDSMSEGDSMDVTCYLLPYELSDKNIRVFDEAALNINQVMNGGTIIDPDSGTNYEIDGILDETLWTLGYVDADILAKYRGYSFSSTTVLDAVFKVAETLNALIVWNTVSKTISFYNADNYGINRGFTVNYGRYLKSLSRESKSDEMVTRLKVFGKDGMSIQGLNINGQNYLEDYTYFLYPFQRDANHNVIVHSYYMSDALCHAILDYSEYMASKKSQFTNLLAQKTPFETALATKKNELAALQEQMAVLDNNIDINKSMNYDYTSLITQKNAKQTEINTKNGEITSVNASLTAIDNQINTLKNSLKYNVFFTPELLNELSDYVIYKEFSNDSYSDEQLLYDDAVKEFEKAKQPQVILTMDIVNFMNIVEAQRDWDKLNLGDIITIRYSKLNLNMEAKIIEITIDFESDNIGLTIANTKDILTDEEKLVKMIYSNNAASTLLDLKSTKWDGIDATTSKVNAIIENTWDAIKTGIEGGVNNTISITERGILVKNTTDPSNFLIIQNGVMAITNDNGNTWKHAITANGIVGERIYGKLLAGSNLVIDASDSGGVKTFTVDGSGVKILGSKLIITGGITEANLSDEFLDALDADILQVQNAVDDLETNVNEILSDGMITSIEASTLKISLAQVTSESSDIITAATNLSITTERTNYTTSLATLTTEINKWIDKTYPMAITATDRTNIKNKFSDIQTKKSILINAISAKRQALSQTYTDQEISEVNTALTTLDNFVDKFSLDSIITLAEANSLKISLNQVNSESADLVAVANTLSITTERTNYSTALSTLTTEINKWIDKTGLYPLTISATDRTNIKSKFEALQAAKSVLINKISSVRQSLSQTYTDGKITTVNNAIADLDSDINLFSSDSIITLSEANALKLSLSQVNSESVDLVSVANTLGITTERTNYSTALATLTTEVNKWIDKTYPLSILAADRTNIKTKFDALQSTKTILINKISSVREQRAKDASVGLGLAYNGVVIDATNGLVITKSDGTVRTILNATEGFSFEKKNGSAWDKKLYYSVATGNLVLDGEFNAKSIKIGGVEVIAGSKIDGDMIDSIKVQQLDATTAKIGTAMIENIIVGTNATMGPNAYISWNNVTGQPYIPNKASDVGAIPSTYIDSSGIWTGYLNADKIIAGSLSVTKLSGLITANQINTNDLSAQKIYQKNYPNNYMTIGGQFGDLVLSYEGSEYFTIYNNISSASLMRRGNVFLDSTGTNTIAYGTWNFSNATVQGVKAVFG